MRASRTLPDFKFNSIGRTGSFWVIFPVAGLTSSGELKLKLGGFELVAITTSYELTVTKGAENVKVGRETKIAAEVTSPLGLAADVFTEEEATISVGATDSVGSKLKLGKLVILSGIGTAVSSSNSFSSSS